MRMTILDRNKIYRALEGYLNPAECHLEIDEHSVTIAHRSGSKLIISDAGHGYDIRSVVMDRGEIFSRESP